MVTEQYALLSPGEFADIPVGGPGGSGRASVPILLWVALGAAVAAIATMGVVWFLRRRRIAPPPPPPVEPPA